MSKHRRLFAALLCAATVSGCQLGSTEPETTFAPQETPAMDIDQLPTLKETVPGLLDLIDAVRREITRLVPATAPWRWSGEFSTGGCVTNGVELAAPSLVSAHAFTEAEWALVLPAVTRLTAEAGLTGTSQGPAHKPGNYDVSFSSKDGRRLRVLSRYASVIGAYIGCRRPGDGLWVDGRVPMPPDPQP